MSIENTVSHFRLHNSLFHAANVQSCIRLYAFYTCKFNLNIPLEICEKIAEFANYAIPKSGCYNCKINNIFTLSWHSYYSEMQYLYKRIMYGKEAVYMYTELENLSPDDALDYAIYMHKFHFEELDKPSKRRESMKSLSEQEEKIRKKTSLISIFIDNIFNETRFYSDEFYFKVSTDLLKNIKNLEIKLSDLPNQDSKTLKWLRGYIENSKKYILKQQKTLNYRQEES